MAGYRHDGAGAVAHQNIIGNKDGDLFAIDGIDSRHALQPHAGLIFGHFGALKIGLAGGDLLILPDSIHIGDAVRPLFDVRVFRRHNHVGSAKEGIGTGGIDEQLIAAGGIKFNLGAGGAADPVDLGGLNTLQIVDIGEVINEALGVGGNLQHPLALYLVDDLAAAALAHTVDHLLIGQHALAAGAPVDGHLLFVGQAFFEKLEEDPLGPLVVAGIGGIDLPVPIEGEAEALELGLKVCHILRGDDLRVDVVFDGEIFGGQAKGIPAHGVQHIIALHPALSGYDIQRGIGTRMADMQSLTGRIRELHQRIVFGLGVVIFGMEYMGFFPLFLPLRFNFLKFVFQRSVLPTSFGA